MPDNENSFAARLNRLFEEKKKPDGTSFSKQDVVDSSPLLSRIHLWRLQTGKVPRPGYEIVKALADFFGVQPDYFFENDEAQDKPTENTQQEELQVMLRSFADLGKDEQEAVLQMIASLKKLKEK